MRRLADEATMLYRLGTGETFNTLQPMAFKNLADMGMVEGDLENLLAANLLDVLFEESELMPIFQERPLQAEADLYALDRGGQLWIFELKRGHVGSEAMLQALSYGQSAGRWTYNVLEKKYRAYKRNDTLSLADVHKEQFQLERALEPHLFNMRQKFIIIGNAANEELEQSVDYWKRQGLSAEFLPYRIYEIGGSHYFEFFALPYDRHRNPSSIKGVLFDTNASYDEEAVWQNDGKPMGGCLWGRQVRGGLSATWRYRLLLAQGNWVNRCGRGNRTGERSRP
jgi:hypothetical protein